MKCSKCDGLLEVLRMCRRLRMRCTVCAEEFHIHEIADQIDAETEEILERYNAIIYD